MWIGSLFLNAFCQISSFFLFIHCNSTSPQCAESCSVLHIQQQTHTTANLATIPGQKNVLWQCKAGSTMTLDTSVQQPFYLQLSKFFAFAFSILTPSTATWEIRVAYCHPEKARTTPFITYGCFIPETESREGWLFARHLWLVWNCSSMLAPPCTCTHVYVHELETELGVAVTHSRSRTK